MNKFQMIYEARFYVKSAVIALLTKEDQKEFLRTYCIAQYLIDCLLNLHDYDFLDENEDCSEDYSRIVKHYNEI